MLGISWIGDDKNFSFDIIDDVENVEVYTTSDSVIVRWFQLGEWEQREFPNDKYPAFAVDFNKKQLFFRRYEEVKNERWEGS